MTSLYIYHIVRNIILIIKGSQIFIFSACARTDEKERIVARFLKRLIVTKVLKCMLC